MSAQLNKIVYPLTPGVRRYTTHGNADFLCWFETYIHGLPMAEAIKLYVGVMDDPRVTQSTIAAMGLIDRAFLLGVLLGRRDVFNPWLFERIREVEREPDGYLDLWAREHYKSTIITYAGVIQEILRDPEVTTGLFSHTRPIAKGFMRQIKTEFETNDRLKSLYPDVLWAEPRKESPKWSEDDGIVVKRKTNPKESTVEAWGLVDGQPTSKHFSLVVYDDVVTIESVTTPDMIHKVTSAWELSLNLGAHGGRRWMIGTRYKAADTWRAILDRGAAIPRIYPATEDGTDTGVPVFLSPEVLAKKRRDMGPYTFAAQMLQDPTADRTQGFNKDWIRKWRPERWRMLNRYIIVDPASKKKKTSDYTVMLVIGLGPDNNYYVIDWVRDRMNLSERQKMLFKLHRQYAPIMGVGYEEYGQQADIEHHQYVMEQDNYRFDITPLGGRIAKEDRIKGLVPVFEQGRMYLPEGITHLNYEGMAYDPTTVFIREEYEDFPVCAHDDMLDDLARILDPALLQTWPKQTPTEEDRPDWMKKISGAQSRSWMSR